MSTHSKTCPNCGGPLPPNAPGGHCVHCLLRIGLAVADGGLGLALEEPPAGEDSALRAPHSAFEKVRYVGDYELIKEIGRGGMGVVYKARQASLNRLVALKLVRAGEFADANEVTRFRAEAEAAAHLDHPNIVPIFEVGEHEDRHYFSMKLVEGGSLASRIGNSQWAMGNATPPRAKPLTIGDRLSAIARIVACIARAVHYAHQRGILHRDLKPGNILLDERGQPHISDFGLAKRIDTNSGTTQSGAIVGTPSYIAPEQAAGARQLTTAADIHCLGAILYELLGGQPPFTGATVMETLQKVMHEEPVPPSRFTIHDLRLTNAPAKGRVNRKSKIVNPVDRDLETICLKCLEKDPTRRYGSAEALAEDLERWLNHEPILARPVTPGERFQKWTRRNPLLAGSLAAVLLVTLLGLGGILWQWRSAVTAKADARNKLWQSLGSQAHAERLTELAGRRTRALEAIREASQIRPSLSLRNEAVAALALTDLQDSGWWQSFASPMPYGDWAADAKLERFAVRDHQKAAISLWRIADGQATTLSHNARNGRELAFTRDGQGLAAAYYNGDLVLWDVATCRQRWLFQGLPKTSEGYDLEFSHDERWLALSPSRPEVKFYDVRTGAESAPLVFTNKVDHPVTFSLNPTEGTLAIGLGSSVEVWDYEARRLVKREKFPAGITHLAWHPDGGRLAVTCWYRPEVIVWNIRSGPRRTLYGSTATTHLAFSPSGDLLACRGRDGATRLWNLATDRTVLTQPNGLAKGFSLDGRRLAYDRDTLGVGIWEVLRSEVYQTIRMPDAISEPVEEVAFSPDGRLLTWTDADGFCWLDIASGQVNRRTMRKVYSNQFNPDGQSLFTGGFDGLRQWRVVSTTNALGAQWQFEPMRTLVAPGPNMDLDFRWTRVLPNGGRLAAAARKWAGWVSLNGETDTNRIENIKSIVSLAVSPDQRWMAFGSELDGCQVRDASTLALAKQFPLGSASVLFDPQGRWLLTGTVEEFCLWQVGTWTPVARHRRESALKRSAAAAFNQEGSLLALAHSPDIVRLVDPVSGAELARLTPPARLLITSLAFSPDGNQLAVGSENAVLQLWDLGSLRRQLAGLGLDW
jgi:serine/threonine protein kinase/WD40 repeat protein